MCVHDFQCVRDSCTHVEFYFFNLVPNIHVPKMTAGNEVVTFRHYKSYRYSIALKIDEETISTSFREFVQSVTISDYLIGEKLASVLFLGLKVSSLSKKFVTFNRRILLTEI